MVIGAANLKICKSCTTQSDLKNCWNLSIDMVVIILWTCKLKVIGSIPQRSRFLDPK